MLIKRPAVEWKPTGTMLEDKDQVDFNMREMQADAFNQLNGSQFALLNAPTACGKTLAMCYMVANALDVDKSLRALIIVPQKIIGAGFSSYARLRYALEDGTLVLDEDKVLSWSPAHYLCDDSGKTESSNTKSVQKFLSDDERYSDFNDRIMICTHATFSKTFKKSPELFKNILVCCDEAHHTQLSEESGGLGDDKNCLGDFLQYSLENSDSDVRLILSTATFFRGDSKSIIPEKYVAFFDKFYYPMDRYLSTCCYLSGFSYSFAMYDQKWGDELKNTFDVMDDSKFIVYIPSVHSNRYSYGSKDEDVEKVYQSISGEENPEVIEEDSGLTLIRRGDKWIRIVNLVDDSNLKLREKRLNLIIQAHDHEDDSMIDGIVTLEMFKEGANWKWADTIFLIGAKGSLTAMVQIVGRLLRDAKGKESVDFIQFLPQNINSMDTEEFRENLNDYLKVVFATMIVDDLIRPVSIKIESEKDEDGKEDDGSGSEMVESINWLRMLTGEDVSKEQSILSDIYKNVCRYSDHGVNFRRKTDESVEAFELAVKEAMIKGGLDDQDIEEYHKQIAEYTWKRWLIESVKLEKSNMGVDISEVEFDILIKMGEDEEIDPLSFMETYQAGMSGVKTLKSLRKALNPKDPIPYEEAREIARSQDFKTVSEYRDWRKGEVKGVAPYEECPEGMPYDMHFYKIMLHRKSA